MLISDAPYGTKQYIEINGSRMAYVEHGTGDPIVFQHGNPTSSYLWRNVMPYCEGLGRLIACDLIGMGDSAKLSPSGPERYTYIEQRTYLHALWEALGIQDNVVFVIHDWGSALGFDWARQHPTAVQGIAYMEAIVQPLTWTVWPDAARNVFQAFRSTAGEEMVLQKNIFVDAVLPSAVIRDLTAAEMDVYRAPFKNPGEDRRPTLTWPRMIPIDGEPAEVVAIVEDYAQWMASNDIPKLFINAEPGSILVGPQREFCRTWPHQTEVTVAGSHFVQEDSPDEIGRAVASFVRSLRGG